LSDPGRERPIARASRAALGKSSAKALEFVECTRAFECVGCEPRAESGWTGAQREGGDCQRERDGHERHAVVAPIEHRQTIVGRPVSNCDPTPEAAARVRIVRHISCWRVLQPVAVPSKSLADYVHICGRELIAEIWELAEPLKGSRVVH